MVDFSNKIAIVTGATTVNPGGRSIGGASAAELAAHGAKVVLVDVNIDGAEALAEELNSEHGANTAVAKKVDLRSEQEIAQLVSDTVSTLGNPSVVLNIAGIFPPDDVNIENMSVEAWDNVFAVNLRGTMLMMKHTLPYMRAAGGGAYVNTASTHALAGDDVLTGYGSSKAGVIALTKFAAVQHGREGIRANVICPGTTQSPPAQQLPQAIKDIYAKHTMLPQMNTPKELGLAYSFLASDDARGINGQSINVDGGLLAHQPFLADMHEIQASTV